jgi:FMN reductase
MSRTDQPAVRPVRRIAVLSAGLSQPSSSRLLADRLAGATRAALLADGDTVEVTVIEVRELAHDVTNNLLTGFPAPALKAAVDAVGAADALIAVTPIFNASYSGLFKSFFDILDPESLAGKLVLIGATGGSARHSLALEHAIRPLFSYLKAIVVPTAVYAASSDWGTGGADTALSRRVTQAGEQLAGLLSRAPSPSPTDPFTDAPSFLDLLG